MVDEYIATGSAMIQHGDMELLQVSYEKPNGEMHHHIMTPDVFAIRAEELGLDPDDDDDFDQVVDIILHEPLFDERSRPNKPMARGFASGLMPRSLMSQKQEMVDLVKEDNNTHGIVCNIDVVPEIKDRMRALTRVELKRRKEAQT